MSRPPIPLALLLLGAAHCGGVVIAASDASVADAPPSDGPSVADASPPDVAPAPPPSPPCAVVRASCGASPQQLVRGHAEGLVGLDGARARFAVRYARAMGEGPGGQYGVVAATATVTGGAFEACVCLPRGANEYPAIAALVFAPGAVGESGADVARALYSQRFATLGDEDVAEALRLPAPRAVAEAALAALDDRSLAVTVTGLDAVTEGARIVAGVVAPQRPIAAQITMAAAMGGRAPLRWNMPGRAWAGEGLALLVDRNLDRACDAADLGAFVPLTGGDTVAVGSLVTGAALAPVCAALALDAPRER